MELVNTSQVSGTFPPSRLNTKRCKLILKHLATDEVLTLAFTVLHSALSYFLNNTLN
jgi:hypothetical protein